MHHMLLQTLPETVESACLILRRRIASGVAIAHHRVMPRRKLSTENRTKTRIRDSISFACEAVPVVLWRSVIGVTEALSVTLQVNHWTLKYWWCNDMIIIESFINRIYDNTLQSTMIDFHPIFHRWAKPCAEKNITRCRSDVYVQRGRWDVHDLINSKFVLLFNVFACREFKIQLIHQIHYCSKHQPLTMTQFYLHRLQIILLRAILSGNEKETFTIEIRIE